jgi:hypothetical protein
MDHTNHKFSPETRHILLSAGWFPGRQINIDAFCAGFREAGLKASTAVCSFLSEFGGLRLEYQHREVEGFRDWCTFSGRIPISPLWIKTYSRVVKEDLCVIGTAFEDYMVLLMGPSGSVVAGYDDVLLLVGRDGVEAIERLCQGTELDAIPVA